MKNAAQQIQEKWPCVANDINNLDPHLRDEFMDNELTNSVKKAMEEKLKVARQKGRGGWWSTDCNTKHLREMLKEHIDKGDMRDVMNLSAMIFYREYAGIEYSEKKENLNVK